MSSCLEDFINFENIELDFPESEDIEASIFNLSEITEKKIFSEKLDKQKIKKNKRKGLVKNSSDRKRVKNDNNSTLQNMTTVQNNNDSTVQNMTIVQNESDSTVQNMTIVQNESDSTV